MNESLIEEGLTKQIIGAAIEVHRYWGPGLVESIYEKSLAEELRKMGSSASSCKSKPITPLCLRASVVKLFGPQA